MDVALIGLAADSRPIEDATRKLDVFTGASKRADAANDERTASSRRVATADNAATVASRANTAALQAQAAAARMAAFRQRNLMFQLNDVGVSLISGMNPFMVLAQQGTQITQIYSGPGGVSSAFRDVISMASRFLRVAGWVGLVVTAFAGLQAQINATSDTQVSFFNVVMGTMQELSAMIMTVAGPAIGWLGDVFDVVAQKIFGLLTLIGDSIINVFTWAVRSVVALWNGLPAALGDLMFQAAQNVLSGLSLLIQEGIDLINGMIERANQLPTINIPLIGEFSGASIDNPNAGAADALMNSLGAAYDESFANSPFGAFFERVGERAAALARSANDAASAVGNVGSAAQAAGQPMDLLGQSVQAANDNFEAGRGIFTSFFSDLSSQIQQGASVWDAFKTAGLNALNSVLSKVMEMASNSMFMSLFGGGSGGGGGLLSGLLGSFGGFFANGGTLGAGQWGIAGERGPEPIVGPARIISNDNYMRAANNNAPQPTVIYQTNYITNPYGMEGVGRAISAGNQAAVNQAANVSVKRVADIQRRTARPLG